MWKLNILLLQIILVNSQSQQNLNNVLFNTYNYYYATQTYLGIIAEVFPEKVDVVTIGNTFIGKNILAAKISFNPYGEENRPMILIDAGMHASEWITSPVALYLIQQLVQNHTNIDMIRNVDWFIIPNLNPDGYDYSLTYDNTWRKNLHFSANEECPGVDINRNFDFQWSNLHAMRNECSEDYAGLAPFSEPETRALRDIAIKYQNNIKLYITLHSYGSLIIYPWSYTSEPIHNVDEHQELGNLVAQAIKKYRGTAYEVGSVVEKMYYVNGSSCDWMAGVLGIPLNYGIVLPKSTGELNAETAEILPIAMETFEGFKEFHQYILEHWKLNYTTSY